MKLYIQRRKGNFNFPFLLPTFLLGYKWVWRLILQEDEKFGTQDYEKITALYRKIKKNLKKYGHFILLELESFEGMKIIIKI